MASDTASGMGARAEEVFVGTQVLALLYAPDRKPRHAKPPAGAAAGLLLQATEETNESAARKVNQAFLAAAAAFDNADNDEDKFRLREVMNSLDDEWQRLNAIAIEDRAARYQPGDGLKRVNAKLEDLKAELERLAKTLKWAAEAVKAVVAVIGLLA